MSVYTSRFPLRFFFLVVVYCFSVSVGWSQFNGSGQIELHEGEAELIRNGITQKLTKRSINLKNNDVLKTRETGKIRLTLRGGDQIFLASSSQIDFSEKKKTKGLAKIRSRRIKVKGRLLAQIRKNASTPIQIRTPSAIVAVKGTRFIVEYLNQITTAGTIEGLVELSSLQSQQKIELHAGTMSHVNLSGQIMPIEELSGELLKEFEFAGEIMEESEAAGQKINLN